MGRRRTNGSGRPEMENRGVGVWVFELFVEYKETLVNSVPYPVG